jgi:hypothetical protein
MTPLLGYLIERSIGGGHQAAAADAPGLRDSQADTQEPSRSSNLKLGVIRPRRRSRHEGRPDLALSDPDARMAAEETRDWLQSHGAETSKSEEHEEAPAAYRDLQGASAALTVKPKEASRSIDMAGRRAIAGHLDIQQPGPEKQIPVDGGRVPPTGLGEVAGPGPETQMPVDGGVAPSPPGHKARAVRRVPPVAREERQAAVPSAVPERAERMQAPPQPRKAEPAPLSHAPAPLRSEQASPVLRPRQREIESLVPPRERITHAEEARASRGLSGVSPIVAPHPTSERTSAPRIEVNIGRVEVRAVFAQPPPQRKPRSSPTVSLDDYLKQRDGTG